jgi:hypothetical protein
MRIDGEAVYDRGLAQADGRGNASFDEGDNVGEICLCGVGEEGGGQAATGLDEGLNYLGVQVS